LEIKGSVNPVVPDQYHQPVVREIFVGPFKKSLRLPAKVNTSSVRFEYQGGILAVIADKIV
jgi:HSP20 family molecular chaperone IbpA